jgi:hypothetical protein
VTAPIPWRAAADGLLVAVWLTPKGGRDAIEGVAQLGDGRAVMRARVRAAPVEGEANVALLRLLARLLDVPLRRLSLVAGASARIKQVKIEGDGAVLATALAKALKEST